MSLGAHCCFECLRPYISLTNHLWSNLRKSASKPLGHRHRALVDENIFPEIHWPQLSAIRTTNLLPKSTDAGDSHQLSFCDKTSPILRSSYFQRNRSSDELLSHNTRKDLLTTLVSIALFLVRWQVFVLYFFCFRSTRSSFLSIQSPIAFWLSSIEPTLFLLRFPYYKYVFFTCKMHSFFFTVRLSQ